METEFRPKVVLALIPKEATFLLINRRHPHLGLTWAFPGGMTKEGESEEEAVVREAREEVGVDVEVKQKLLERKHPNTYVEIAYFCCILADPLQQPQILEKNEIKQLEWVPATEVLSKFTSDIHPLIQKFILGYARSRK